MPQVEVNGQVMYIPQEGMSAFTKDYPDANIHYAVDKDTLSIPIKNSKDFLTDYPQAKTIGDIENNVSAPIKQNFGFTPEIQQGMEQPKTEILVSELVDKPQNPIHNLKPDENLQQKNQKEINTVYGKVPGLTKLSLSDNTINTLPIDYDMANHQFQEGKNTETQKSITDNSLESPVKLSENSVYGKTPQLKTSTITSDDVNADQINSLKNAETAFKKSNGLTDEQFAKIQDENSKIYQSQLSGQANYNENSVGNKQIYNADAQSQLKNISLTDNLRDNPKIDLSNKSQEQPFSEGGWLASLVPTIVSGTYTVIGKTASAIHNIPAITLETFGIDANSVGRTLEGITKNLTGKTVDYNLLQPTDLESDMIGFSNKLDEQANNLSHVGLNTEPLEDFKHGNYLKGASNIGTSIFKMLPEIYASTYLGGVGGYFGTTSASEHFDSLKGRKDVGEQAKAISSVATGVLTALTMHLALTKLPKVMPFLGRLLEKNTVEEAKNILSKNIYGTVSKVLKGSKIWFSPVAMGVQGATDKIASNMIDYASGVSTNTDFTQGVSPAFQSSFITGLGFKVQDIANSNISKLDYSKSESNIKDLLSKEGFSEEDSNSILEGFKTVKPEDRNGYLNNILGLMPSQVKLYNNTGKIDQKVLDILGNHFNSIDKLSQHNDNFRYDIEDKQSEINNKNEKAKRLIKEYAKEGINPDFESLIFANTKLGNGKIAQGKIYFDQYGNVDYDNSDKSLIFKDSNGDDHNLSIEDVFNITKVVPVENTLNENINTGNQKSDRETFSNRLKSQLSDFADPETGDIVFTVDVDGNKNYIYGSDRSGKIIGINDKGETSVIGKVVDGKGVYNKGTKFYKLNIENLHASAMNKWDKENPKNTEINPKKNENTDYDQIVNPPVPEGLDLTDPNAHVQIGLSVIDAQQAMDKALSGSKFKFNQEVTELSPDQQKSVLNEVQNDEELTPEQKKSIFDFVRSAAAARKAQETINSELATRIQKEQDIASQDVNPTTGTIVRASIKGDDKPLVINGNLQLKTDESTGQQVIDPENSDETVAYANEKGEIVPISPENLTLISSTPLEEEHAAIKNSIEAEHLQQQQAVAQQIAQKTAEKQASEQQDPLQGINNGDTVDYIDDNGDTKSGTINIDPVLVQEGKVFINDEPISIENIIKPENVNVSNPQENPIPIPQHPILKDGTPDFMNMTDDQIYNYTKETEGEEAAQVLVSKQIKRLHTQIMDNQRAVSKLSEETNKLLAKSKNMQEQRAIEAKQALKAKALKDKAENLNEELKNLNKYLPKVETPVKEETTPAKPSTLRPEIAQLQKEQADKKAKAEQNPQDVIEPIIPSVIEQTVPEPIVTDNSNVTDQKQTKKTITPYQQRIRNLGEYLDMEDYILTIIAGGQKFKWKTENGKKGMADELGFGDKNGERLQRRNLIDEKNGITPQELAHQIYETYGENGNMGEIPGVHYMSDHDILNIIVNDILLSTTSNTQALEKAEAKRKNFDLDPEDYVVYESITPEEQDYLDQIPDDILKSYLGITNFTPEQLDVINELHNNYETVNTKPADTGTGERNQKPTIEEPIKPGQGDRQKDSEQKFLTEKEYIKQKLLDYINKEGISEQDFEDSEQYNDVFNEASNLYPQYISDLKDSGKLQEYFDNAKLGDKIAIRKGIETAGFEVNDFIDTNKEKKEAKTKREADKKSEQERLFKSLGIDKKPVSDSGEVKPPMTNSEGYFEHLHADLTSEIGNANVPPVAENELRSRFGLEESNGTQLTSPQKQLVDDAELSIRKKLGKIYPELQAKNQPKKSETISTPSQRFDVATTPEERYTSAVEVVKELEKILHVGMTPAEVLKTTDDFMSVLKTHVADADFQKAVTYLASGQKLAAVRLSGKILINMEHNDTAEVLAQSYMHETAHKAFDVVFHGEDLSNYEIPNIQDYIPSVYWGEDNAMKATEVVAHYVEKLLNNYTPEQIKNGEIDLSLLNEDVQYIVTKTLNKLTNGKIDSIGQERFNDLNGIPASDGGIQADGHSRKNDVGENGNNQPDNGKPETERDRILREKLEKLRGKLGLNEKPEYKRYEIPKDFKDNLGIRRELSGGISIIENFPNEETLYEWEEKRLPELVSEALRLVENVRKGKYLDQEEIGNLSHIFMQARKHNYDGWDNSDVENVYSILVHEGMFKPLNKEKFEEIYQNIRKQVKPQFKRLDPETTEIALDVTEMLFEDGDIAFADYSARMIDALGEGIKPYLSGFYELSRASIPTEGMTPAAEVANFDIKNFNHKEYVSNRSGRGEQNSTPANEVQGDAKPISGNGSGSGSVGTGIPKSGGKTSRQSSGTSGGNLQPTLFGEQSNNDLLSTESTVEKPTTGDTDGRGNGIDSPERHFFNGGTSKSGHQDNAGLPETFKQRTARKIIEQRNAESIPVTLMDEANIRETLPLLLPEQQDDVLKAENRFFGDQHKNPKAAYGKGMLFTNGTGTGKTYTGLGIAKRFDKQGKKNILIVVPSEAKIGDWVKDGYNIGLHITPLASTKDAGENTVITTYANFRANEALKDRDFDLVIYDESHRLMEEKNGATSSTTNSHYAHSNISESQAFHKLQSINPAYQEIKALYEQIATAQDKRPLEEKALQLQKAYNENIKPELLARAKAAYENTKVVFLSATPFKGHFNLRYANGSLFDWGNETITNERGSRVNPEAQFYLNNFGSAYEWKFHRLQTKRNSNAEAIAMQEVEFSQLLMAQGVMSGRAIESDKDYSREFPLVALDKAEVFNQALNEIYSDEFGGLSKAAHNVFSDYNYTTKLFESLKASMNIQRIQQHLDLGRKVIVFHRRKQANVLPPFQSILDQTRQLADGYVAEAAQTNDIAKKAELIHKAYEMRKQSEAFEIKYADLLKWEQTLNYNPAIQQIDEAFPGKVVFLNGDTPKKDKSKNVQQFNDDNSGKDIIVVQEESGKEGISLHDTTGKFQRALISLSLPQSSTTTLQIEGRPYRIGNESDAIIEYPLLGLDQEIADFGQKINKRLSTTENLAIGDQARDLLRSFAEGVLFNSSTDAPNTNQGKGGKEYDKKAQETLSEFRKAVLVYNTNQKTTGRRDQREGQDYYATPEPIGQKMVEWLGLQAQERALEPSAGHGAIAMWFPEKSNVTVVEPSYKLFSKLNARAGGGDRKMINDVFENLNIINKFNGIAMNPPFGSGGKTAIDHVSKAFGHLHNNGRIVSIIPQGQADVRLDKFLGETPNAHLIASIKLPVSTFEQAGTKVGTRIVVIDRIDLPKRHDVNSQVVVDNFRSSKSATYEEEQVEVDRRMNEFSSNLPHTENVDLSGAKNIDELFNDIEDLEVQPRQNSQETPPPSGSLLKEGANDGKFEQFEQKHSKTGEQTYMVSPKEFFDRDTYNKLVSIAKNNEGYFSSYSNKAQNIRSGFTFKTQEDADKFKIDADREVGSVKPEYKMIPNTDFDKEIEVEKKRYNGDSFEIKDDTLYTTHYRVNFQTPSSTEHIYDGINIDDAIRGAKWDTNDYDWDDASVGINATHIEIPIEKVKKHFEEEGYEDFDINSDLDYSELNDYINSIDTYDYTKDEDYYTYSNSIADNKTSDELIYEVQSELKNRFGKYIGKYSTVYVNKEGEITADSSDDEGNDNTPVSIRIADHTHNPRNRRSDVTVVIANKNKTVDKFRGARTDLEFDEEYSSDEIANEIEQFIKDNFEYGSKPEYKIIPEKPEFTPEKPIHQYATEINAYNEKIKAIEERKKELKKEHDAKEISNIDFVTEAKKLNSEKLNLESKKNEIEVGTDIKAENIKTVKPDFKDFNGDLLKYSEAMSEYNKKKRAEYNARIEEKIKLEKPPKMADFVGKDISEYRAAWNKYNAARRVLNNEPDPETKKQYRNIVNGLKGAKNEVVATDIPEIRQLYKDMENEFLGNKDVEKVKAAIEAKEFHNQIKETLKNENISDLENAIKEKHENNKVTAKDINTAIQIYIDSKNDPESIKKYYNGLTPEQQRTIDISQNLTPEQKEIADKIAKSYEDLGMKAMSEEVISNTLENYVRRQWDLTGEKGRDYFAKFSTTTGHKKHRKIVTIVEGWASGLELKTQGAVENLQALKDEINNVIESNKLINTGLNMKGENGVPLFSLKKETGYEEIRHPNFTKWVQQKNVNATSDLRGENWAIDKDGKVFEKKKIYAPKQIADRLNNILGKYNNGLNGVTEKIVAGADKFNATVKSTILSFSFYHHQAFARQYMFGAAFGKISDANLFTAYKAGYDMLLNMTPEVEMLIHNGMTVARIQDWEEDILQQKGEIGKTLDKLKVTKAIQDKIQEAHDKQTQFLFSYYGAGLKVKMATMLLHEQMAKHPDIDPMQLAKEVAEFANNSFGGINRERYARNPKVQKWLNRLMLAPDWTESNLKSLIKVFGFDYTQFGEEGYSHGFNKDKEQAKRERRLYQKLYVNSVLRSNIISALFNILVSSPAMALLSDDKDTWLDKLYEIYKDSIDPLLDFSLEDESFMSNLIKIRDTVVKSHFSDMDITFIPKAISKISGKEFDDNERYYFSTAGHFKDPAKWILDPATAAKHKASVIAKIALDGITGKDWQGKRFTNISEFLGTDDKGVYDKSIPKKGIHVGDPKGGRLQFQTVKYGTPYETKAVQLDEIPSYLINEVLGMLPIPIHNTMNLFNGELDGFTTMTRGLGMNVSSETMKDHDQVKYDRAEKHIKNSESVIKGQLDRYKEAVKNKNIAEQADYLNKYHEANTIQQQTLKEYIKIVDNLKSSIPNLPKELQEKASEQMDKFKNRVIELYKIKDPNEFENKTKQYLIEDRIEK